MAIDYKKLNQITRKDAFPMPRVVETIEQLKILKCSRYFSLLDCNQGYYQLRLAEEDIQKSALCFDGELWEFRSMPFGLSGAPATFARMMEVLFANEPNIVIYFDDICVQSRTLGKHIQGLKRCLEILRKNGSTLNEKKCAFFQEKVEFLGFTIEAEKVRLREQQLQAIEDFPKPKNARALKCLQGMAGYY